MSAAELSWNPIYYPKPASTSTDDANRIVRHFVPMKVNSEFHFKCNFLSKCSSNFSTWLGFHDNSSTDISSTTLRLQTFRLLLLTSVQDSYTSNFCFNKSFSSIPTSTYTRIPFYQSHFH